MDKLYMLNKVVMGTENWVFMWDFCDKCLCSLQEEQMPT